MKLAHVREAASPTADSWRLAAALPSGDWLILEEARDWLVATGKGQATASNVYGSPLKTLDSYLASAMGTIADIRTFLDRFVESIAEDKGDSTLGTLPGTIRSDAQLVFGPPLLYPRSFRDFYAFEGHVRTTWGKRGEPVPEAWYRMPIFYFGNVSEIRGPGDVVWAPDNSTELDYELEVGAVIDLAARNLSGADAELAIGGFCIVNDWSARDLQRYESTVRLGPAKGKDFATSIGPWLVTPDELGEMRSRKGYRLAMTASVNSKETSRGWWSDIQFSFAEMIEQASRDALLRPGDLLASGTVGTGCLLEIGSERLGRYLLPGDDVVLSIERLGSLNTPIGTRPALPPTARETASQV